MKKFLTLILALILAAALASTAMAAGITSVSSDYVYDENMAIILQNGESVIGYSPSQFQTQWIEDENKQTGGTFYSSLNVPSGYAGGKVLSVFTVSSVVSPDKVDSVYYTGVPAAIGDKASDLYLYFVSENATGLTTVAKMAVSAYYHSDTGKLAITSLPAAITSSFWLGTEVTEGESTYTMSPRLILVQATGSGPSAIESVAVTPATLSLKVGASQTLAAAVKPDTAAQTVTWTSDKAAVATVDSAGKVTAVAAGTATITATSTADTAKTAKCAVTVVADVTTPKIDSSVTIPASVDATQKTVAYTDAAAAAKDISCDIAATDIEVKDGAAVVKADTANAIITTALAENEVIDGVKPLPIFHVTTTKDVATALAYVKGSDLLAEKVEDVTIFKLLSKSSAMEFEYTATPAEFADGKFTILDDAGKVASGAIEAEKYYQVLLFIKDGGEFDMDGAKNGAVVDPAAVASVSEKTSGGSSSGCSAGVGVIALFAIAALPLWRKKK